MNYLSYIIWNLEPKVFPNGILGWEPTVVWYGLLFALGFLFGQQILISIYKKEGKPEKDIETLTVYMIVATVIGARLGHVLFYEPERYLSNPLEILQIWKGGLASHGAAFGILFALWIYSKYDIRFKGLKLSSKRITRPGQNFLQVVDRIVIVVALAGALIRLGNFTNSEIEGIPTHSEYGVVFMKNITDYVSSVSPAVEEIEYNKGDHPVPDNYVPVTMTLDFDERYNLNVEQKNKLIESNVAPLLSDQRYFISGHIYQPRGVELDYKIDESTGNALVYLNGISRHPAQLYESLTTFLIFLLLLYMWSRRKEYTPPGLLLGTFLIILFGLRIVHEYYKENQVSFEDNMVWNMGQILSVPLVIAGILILFYALRHKTLEGVKTSNNADEKLVNK